MNRASQTVEECFTRKQVLRILGLSDRQLSAWERQGLLEPRPTASAKASDRAYTFSDIVTLRTLLQLRREGVPPARIRSVHAALKAKLVEVERPWSELQVQADGKRLAVHFQGSPMEPLTGQFLLEYAPRHRTETVRVLKRPQKPAKLSEASLELRAEHLFRAGLRYEMREKTLPKAIRAYQKAIELNPRAGGALINLGTIYYNLGRLEQAAQCYQAALALDSNYALAHFNLANVHDERRQWEEARRHYEEAVRLSPNYPDPHYNLALVYGKLGLHGKARRQWLEYVKLDPYSQWAAVARQQLAQTPLRVLSRPESSPCDS